VEQDGVKVTDISKKYTIEELAGDGVVIRRGKKSYRRVSVK
jgi:tyrosyl-tRNA synthetase